MYTKKKKVNIFSTMHISVNIAYNLKKLLETVSFYNSAKCGVDVLDQLSRFYTTRAASKRWPVYVFLPLSRYCCYKFPDFI